MLHFSTKTFSFSSRRHKQQQRRGHFTFISHPPNYRSTHTPADLTVSLPTSLLQLWSEPRPSKAGHTPRPTITTTEETAGEHPAPPPPPKKKRKKNIILFHVHVQSPELRHYCQTRNHTHPQLTFTSIIIVVASTRQYLWPPEPTFMPYLPTSGILSLKFASCRLYPFTLLLSF